MIAQDCLRTFHQYAHFVCAFAARQEILYRSAGDVMRRLHLQREWPLGPDQQMSVLHASVELQTVAAEIGLHRLDQRTRFFAGDVAGGIIGHTAIFDGDEVTAEGHVAGPEGNVGASRLDGGAARVIFLGVVAEQAHVGYITARWKAGNRHGLYHAALACRGQPAHV